jgi:beta-lactamase class A
VDVIGRKHGGWKWSWPWLGLLLSIGAGSGGFLAGGWLALRWGQPTLIPTDPTPTANTSNPLEPSTVIPPGQLIYNVRTAPPTTYNPQLQATVNQMVDWVQQQGLPLPALSITLMDVTQPDRPQIAGYQQQEFRYPASVVKLFWLTTFLAYQQAGLISPKGQIDLRAMMQQSSNDAASAVVDAITGTESGAELSPALLAQWRQDRERLNHFFRGAGYGYLNLKHKNFPIYSLGHEEPQGRELQLRGGVAQPSRNQLTTWQTARLLYEIYTLQAVSPRVSQEIQTLIERPADLAGFLGANLPPDAIVMGKEGQTSTTRHDGVIITRTDGRLAYILVVFGDDPAYSADDQFLPALSRLSWQAMNRLHP